MNEQTTIRAAVAVSPSAAVVYLEGVDCPHCATPINQSYRVASPCRNPRQHAVETVWNWRKIANSGPEDYHVVDLVITDHGDQVANTVAARIVALGDRPITVHVDIVSPGRGLVTCGEGDFSGGITRQHRRYLIETEAGDVIGHAHSYRAAAIKLAAHHGFHNNINVEIDHE